MPSPSIEFSDKEVFMKDGEPDIDSLYKFSSEIIETFEKMSSKINIITMLSEHIHTLYDANNKDEISKKDIGTFYIFPLLIAVFFYICQIKLSDNTLQLIVTFGAIIAGLLLNLLVLVYTLKEKLPSVNEDDEKHNTIQLKHTVSKELCHNIAYCVVISIFIVFIVIFTSILPEKGGSLFLIKEYLNSFSYSFVIFLIINLLLTIIMIIKRFNNLLNSSL